MAPRRLILTMFLLLGVSTVIAVITPDPRKPASDRQEQPDPVRGSTGESGQRPPPKPEFGPQQGAAALPVLRATVISGGEVDRIEARPGQRVVLEVRSRKFVEVDIPGIGRTAFADRWAPAVFDVLLPDRRESLEVVPLSGESPIARIEVR